MSPRPLLLLAVLAVPAGAGGFNDAGCGLGAQIWTDNTRGQQVLAATTNQYFGQVFSVTSGRSSTL